MAVPKQRHTKSRRDRRRAHISLKKPTLTKCPKCGHYILTHTVCAYCGYYKGKQVINVLEKLEKKERKKREKEIRLKEKEKEKKPVSWEEMSKKKG